MRYGEPDASPYRIGPPAPMRRSLTAVVVAAIAVVTSSTSASATTPVAALDRSLDAILSTSGATALSVRVDVAGRGDRLPALAGPALNPASTAEADHRATPR